MCLSHTHGKCRKPQVVRSGGHGWRSSQPFGRQISETSATSSPFHLSRRLSPLNSHHHLPLIYPRLPHYFFFPSTSLSHSLLHPSPRGRSPWTRRSTFPICCFFEVRPSFPRNLSSLSSFTLHLPSPFSLCSASSSAPSLLQLNILLFFLGESSLSLSSPALLSHAAPLWSTFQMRLCESGGTFTTPHPSPPPSPPPPPPTHKNTHSLTHHQHLQLDPDVSFWRSAWIIFMVVAALGSRFLHLQMSCYLSHRGGTKTFC